MLAAAVFAMSLSLPPWAVDARYAVAINEDYGYDHCLVLVSHPRYAKAVEATFDGRTCETTGRRSGVTELHLYTTPQGPVEVRVVLWEIKTPAFAWYWQRQHELGFYRYEAINVPERV